MSGINPVIIKRGRRNTKAQHSGAWKVAFADFTLAMMAFFMVLWILEVSNLKERTEIANYMRTHSILDGSPNPFQPDNSPFPVDLGGTPSIVERDAAHSVPPENPVPGMSEFLEVPAGERNPMAGMGDKLNSMLDGKFDSPSELSLLLQAFQEIAAEQLAENHLLVEVVPSGLRVIIRDNEQQQMFRRGQVEMTPFFEDLLLSMGPLLKKIQNKLIISGHTDITSFSGTQYGNWELSGDRALQARQVLTAGGMPAERVAQVAAFAATRLINENDKTSSENRRIELLILTTRAEDELNQLFSPAGDSPALQEAAGAARRNQPVMRTNL
ncbi:OmpA family protein [Chromatiaceae bacterium AAb-1]|nr:OmpA family protein [Chromatiaceae bacterium AAb-1]